MEREGKCADGGLNVHFASGLTGGAGADLSSHEIEV